MDTSFVYQKDSAERDYASALSFVKERLALGWRTIDWIDRPLRWRFFEPQGVASPPHGWKIHISASAVEAAKLLRELANLFAQFRLPFKVPQYLEDVVLLNSGDVGAEQMGKVLTVYPPDVENARIAITALDAEWPNSRGPEVITDWQVRTGSAVSFRYGVYRITDEAVDSMGVHHFGWRKIDGSFMADQRISVVQANIGTPELPVLGVAPEASSVMLNQPLRIAGVDYLPLVLLARTPRLSTWLAAHLESLSTVVIKSGRRGAAGDMRGLDVRDLMRNEYLALSQLELREGLAPRPLAFVDERQPLLVMADFRGESLSDLSRFERIAALPLLAEAVAQMHEAGLVHGDIKLENAVYRSRTVGLIDFELSAAVGVPMRAGGTPGYLDPTVRGRTLPASTARDVFALGSCIVQALLGIPPGLLPTGRAVALLRNEGLFDAADCVQHVQSADTSARPDATSVAKMLFARVKTWQYPNQFELFPRHSATRWEQRAAIDAAHASKAFIQPRELGSCWRNEHFMRAHDCEGINLGTAGIILGLLSIDSVYSCADFSSEVAAGSAWLTARRSEDKSAGLFTGNAGVALALAVSGRRLSDKTFIRAAHTRFETAARDYREVDLFSGLAGVVWTAVLLRDLLNEDWPLDVATDAFNHLRQLQIRCEGVPVWVDAGSNDTAFFGCAHGSAGIAMALASWGRATGDETAISDAHETWSAILQCARTADGRALRIGPGETRHHAIGNWCHGVAGYLWSILNSVGDDPELQAEIDWAVHVLAQEPSVGTPTFCHGLAGQLELWQMLRAVPRYSTLARMQSHKVAHALRCVHVKVDGKCVWTSDDTAIITPDLWIGFLGPASALARHTADLHDALLSSPALLRMALSCNRPKSETHYSVGGSSTKREVTATT
ncbi:MAG: lanthionine synthetase LanC family protein [Nitrospira sp.]